MDKVIKNGKLLEGQERIPTIRMQLVLSVEMAEALDAIAALHEMSKSEVVRRLIEGHITATANKAELEKVGIKYQPIYYPC